MSFYRTSSAVDLVEKSLLSRTSLLCMAGENNKVFIALKIIEERLRRSSQGAKAILITDDINDVFIEEFIEAVHLQTALSTVLCDNKQKQLGCLDTQLQRSDVIIGCAADILDALNTITTSTIAVVIIDKCHLVLEKSSPVGGLLQHFILHDGSTTAAVVGLVSSLLTSSYSPEKLEYILSSVELMFKCKMSVSSDVLAMNRYGEQPLEEVVIPDSIDPCFSNINQVITMYLSNALRCLDKEEESAYLEPITHVRSLLTECHSVLPIFGPWSAIQTGKYISKEIAKIIKKLTKTKQERLKLVFQSCNAELGHIQEGLQESENIQFPKSPLLDKIIDALSVFCTTNKEDNDHQRATPSAYFKDKPKENPIAVILAPSDVHARALNELINHISESQQLSHVRSRYLLSSKIRQATGSTPTDSSVESSPVKLDHEPVMQQLQNGAANILVVSRDNERSLYLPQCMLVIRFGMPEDYLAYVAIKSIAKYPEPQVLFIETRDLWNETGNRYKAFQDVEKFMLSRCPSCLPIPSVVNPQIYEATSNSPEVYAPYGASGPKLTIDSSIALINNYCAQFPSDGLGRAAPYYHTHVTDDATDQDDQLMMTSILYLPRNSPVSQQFKGTLKLNKDSLDIPEVIALAERKCQSLAALEACKGLHDAGELDASLQCGARCREYVFKGMDDLCATELADNGHGRPGSVQRRRVYRRQFPSVLKNSLPRPGQRCYLYAINLELTKPGTHGRAIRSQGPRLHAMTTGAVSMGIILNKPLPQLPSFVIYDRAGEVTVTIHKSCDDSVEFNKEELSLIHRFHRYVFTHVVPLEKDVEEPTLSFDTEGNDYGYYLVLLEDAGAGQCQNREECSSQDLMAASQSCDDVRPCQGAEQLNTIHNMRIAFDDIHALEQSLVSFENPQEPPPIKVADFEVYRDRVLTTAYTKQHLRYYVVDICYDESPSSPFPSPLVASTFGEYYKSRYDVDLAADQPLLDVDHVSKRLNFTVPRYQTSKGKNLSHPNEQSKRYQRSRVFLIPEMCSIHPIPAPLWRNLTLLPSILYRMESLLLAEELRQRIAHEAGVGPPAWPIDQPLPLLTMGETVGEGRVGQVLESVSPEGDTELSTNESIDVDEDDMVCDKETMSNRISQEDVRNVVEEEDNGKMNLEKRLRSVCLDDGDVTDGGQAVDHSDNPPVSNSSSLTASRTQATIAENSVSITDGGQAVDHSITPSVIDTSSLTASRTQATIAGNSVSITDGGQAVDHSDTPSVSVSSSLTASRTQATIAENSTADISSSLVAKPKVEALDIELGPSSTLILRALTTNGVSDIISNERLELYGDAFIKHVVTSKLYCDSQHQNEGKLSFLRGLRVSNQQLFYLGRNRGISSMIFNRLFEPLVSWLPPGFSSSVKSDLKEVLRTCATEDDDMLDEEKDEECSFSDQDTSIGNSTTTKFPLLHPGKFTVASDKTVADATEALIGAYLITSGANATLKLMDWLGIDVLTVNKKQTFTETREKDDIPDSFHGSEKTPERNTTEDSKVEISYSLYGSEKTPMGNTTEGSKVEISYSLYGSEKTPMGNTTEGAKGEIYYSPYGSENTPMGDTTEGAKGEIYYSPYGSEKTPMGNTTEGAEGEIYYSPYGSEKTPPKNTAEDSIPTFDDNVKLSSEFNSVEETLGYSFKDKKLLLQTFTHTYYPRGYNSVEGSNEQLEFLGDALLDYLVTRYLIRTHHHLSPGALTDLRSAIVNNYSLAWLAVKYGLHRHLRSMSLPLFRIVNRFIARLQEMRRKHMESKPDQVYSKVFITLDEDGDCQAIEVPKPLGDLFEAVVGAVYIDTGLDEEQTWTIVYPLLKPIIDHYSHHLPISPIRQLLEMLPDAAKFTSVSRTVTGQFTCTLTVKGYGNFTGSGRNAQIAKSSAAQHALVRIHAKQTSKKSAQMT